MNKLRDLWAAQLKPFPINGLMLGTYFGIAMALGMVWAYMELEQGIPWAVLGLMVALIGLFWFQANLLHKSGVIKGKDGA